MAICYSLQESLRWKGEWLVFWEWLVFCKLQYLICSNIFKAISQAMLYFQHIKPDFQAEEAKDPESNQSQYSRLRGWPQEVFSRGAAPSAPREVVVKPVLGGETGGPEKQTSPARTGSDSPDCSRQRPRCKMPCMYRLTPSL